MSVIPYERYVLATYSVNVSRSTERARVLVFNCTSGRAGGDFLAAMFAKAKQQLAKHASADMHPGALFNRVIFCANVTYADGGFKGGACILAYPFSVSRWVEADRSSSRRSHDEVDP